MKKAKSGRAGLRLANLLKISVLSKGIFPIFQRWFFILIARVISSEQITNTRRTVVLDERVDKGFPEYYHNINN